MRYSEGDIVYFLHPDLVPPEVDDTIGYPTLMQKDILKHLDEPITVAKCARSLSGLDVYILRASNGDLVGKGTDCNSCLIRKYFSSEVSAWLFTDEMLDHNRSDGILPV